jgi:hypothetical protein
MFNEPITPSTISGATVLLAGPGGAAVVGTVSYPTTGSVPLVYALCQSCLQYDLQATILSTALIQWACNWQQTTCGASRRLRSRQWSQQLRRLAQRLCRSTRYLIAPFSEAVNLEAVNATTFLLNGRGGTSLAESELHLHRVKISSKIINVQRRSVASTLACPRADRVPSLPSAF